MGRGKNSYSREFWGLILLEGIKQRREEQKGRAAKQSIRQVKRALTLKREDVSHTQIKKQGWKVQKKKSGFQREIKEDRRSGGGRGHAEGWTLLVGVQDEGEKAGSLFGTGRGEVRRYL